MSEVIQRREEGREREEKRGEREKKESAPIHFPKDLRLNGFGLRITKNTSRSLGLIRAKRRTKLKSLAKKPSELIQVGSMESLHSLITSWKDVRAQGKGWKEAKGAGRERKPVPAREVLGTREDLSGSHHAPTPWAVLRAPFIFFQRSATAGRPARAKDVG